MAIPPGLVRRGMQQWPGCGSSHESKPHAVWGFSTSIEMIGGMKNECSNSPQGRGTNPANFWLDSIDDEVPRGLFRPSRRHCVLKVATAVQCHPGEQGDCSTEGKESQLGQRTLQLVDGQPRLIPVCKDCARCIVVGECYLDVAVQRIVEKVCNEEISHQV